MGLNHTLLQGHQGGTQEPKQGGQIIQVKEVSVISRNPPCKNGNARFTTVPLKPLHQLCGRYFHFSRFKSVYI